MREYLFTGTVEALGIRDIPNIKESRVVNEVEITAIGIKGDTHGGPTEKSKPWRQHYLEKGLELVNLSCISMTSLPELAVIAVKLGIPEIKPGWLSENICVSGLEGKGEFEGKDFNLTEIPAGIRFIFHDSKDSITAVLMVMMANPPCGIPGKNIQRYYPEDKALPKRFKEEAIGNRGLILIVEKEGTIKVGDSFGIAIPDGIRESWRNFEEK